VTRPLPDVVYVVRPGENEELRYSLRSVAANLPHRRVFVAGTVLPWLRNVVGIPLDPMPEKFSNQRQSLTAAVGRDDLSSSFVLLNDDHFVCESVPSTALPTFHRGPVADYAVRQEEADQWLVLNDWWDAVKATAGWALPRCPDLCAYECHTPLMFHKARLARVLTEYPTDRPFAVGMTYSLTGAGGPGRSGLNVKCANDFEFAMKWGVSPYLSSNDESFDTGAVGRYIRGLFPEPCRYEEI
jgi:hypothetical protein